MNAMQAAYSLLSNREIHLGLTWEVSFISSVNLIRSLGGQQEIEQFTETYG